MGALAVDTWAQVRRANPDTVICCDPIIGDDAEGLYVSNDLVDFYRREIGSAQVLFPNRFELECLSEKPAKDLTTAVSAARALLSLGPEMIVATSVPEGICLSTLLATKSGVWRTTTPALPLRAKGAGDFLAANWLGAFLANRDPVKALQQATSATSALIGHASTRDTDELPLITAQAAWIAPAEHLSVDKLNI